ncbi:hypothetical protein Vretifemale_19369 [Volvox reticuliferus]|uniref:Uncharacterized protein n=1 Tax=Volvox reticuliferus TaxID=1737510 RepID=A0A8J4D1E3_9CHLO|nr:hypothetical protein Vretifemale_19369 [Volvox reticuliferus]
MQETNGNVLESLSTVSAQTPTDAPSPPTSTPNLEDAAAVSTAAVGNAPLSVAAAPLAAPCPAVAPAAPSAMAPPTSQATATTPSGGAQQSQQTSSQDPITGYLLQDPAFVAAVRRQDPMQAAQAAAKTIKLNLTAITGQIKPQQVTALGTGAPPGMPYGPTTGAAAVSSGCLIAGPSMAGGFPGAMSSTVPPGMGIGERRISDPDGRFKRGGSCEPVDLTGGGGPGRVRELRRGDWVMIRSANKSTDPELLGHDAWVARVEHNGWVELQVPKLGRTVKLQQRYLQLITPQHPMMMGAPPGLGPPPTAAGVAAPPPPMGLPPPSRRATSDAGGGGMGPPSMPYTDEQGRPYKRPQLDSSIRPALLLEALPSARVASTPGRGGSFRVKDIVRTIRRELLFLEEAVPWHYVTPAWKNARPGWRRSLQRNVDSPAAAAAAAAAAAGGGVGVAAAAAAAADAAAAAAMAALVGTTAASMLELHDALTTEKSQGLFARRGAWETRLRELAEGGNNHACLQVLWSEMAEGIRLWLAGGSALPGTPGGITTTPAATGGTSMPPYSRSYDGTASDRGGDAYMGQPLSEDDYYMAAAAAHQHHQSVQHLQQPSPFLDYAATAGPPGSGRGGNGAAAAAAACRPPATPWMMRSELSVLLQSVDAELDTDLDEGPDATDVEGEDGGENDSDVDPLAAARRLRRRRLRCRQISEHDEQRRQQQQPDQQPAPPADAEMPDAETAAAAEGEQQDGGVSGGAGMPIEAPAPAAAAAVEATPGRGKVEGADSGDSTTDANAAGEAAAPASGTGVAEPMDVDSGTPGPPPSGLGSTTEAALGGMPEAPGVPGGGEGSS